MKIALMTHRGAVREENQDVVFVSGIIRTSDMDAPEICDLNSKERPILLAVIDGMGGHEGGALAAKIVSDTLTEKTDKKNIFDVCMDINDDERMLRHVLAEAARRMRMEALINPMLSEMGAAVSGVLLREKSALAFNCGDCRVYRFSDGYLERVTRDHSIVQTLFEQEEISEEEMRRHPKKNVITSSISAELGDDFELYVKEMPLRDGDSFLVCSDGVWETLSSRKLAEMLALEIPLQDAARELFNVLLSANCRDNVSFIYYKAETIEQ